MKEFTSILFAGLLCAVDWAGDDNVVHSGQFVYTEADANAWAEEQRNTYPTYTVTVRCEKH